MGKKEKKAKEVLEARRVVSKAEQVALDEANRLRDEAVELLEDTRRAARENLEWAEKEARAVIDSANEEADEIRSAVRTEAVADDTVIVSLIEGEDVDRLRKERDDAQRRVGEQAGRLAEEALTLLKSLQELGALVVEAANGEAQHIREEAAQLEDEVAARRAAVDAEIEKVITEATDKLRRITDPDA
jgi:F0F1-type ATP synthase membrane subunit b/b'